MPIGSGLASQFGISKETVVGTFVAPTVFHAAKSAQAARVANRVQGEGVRSGAMLPLASHYVETTNAGTGAVAMDVTSGGMGKLLQNLMGTSGIAQQAATAAWLQTHTLGDTYGLGLSVQVGAPYRSGTVRPHTLLGAKITSAEFSCTATEILQASLNFDAKSWTDSQSLATAAYSSTALPFHGGQMAVKVGAYGSEAAVTGVRGFSLSINRPYDVDDYTAGGLGLKGEPVLNGLTEITGSFTSDWLDKATFQDRAASTASTSVVIEFVGPLIASTYYETIRFVLPGTMFEPSTQGVDGPGELTNQWSFKVGYDGTNLPKIEYMSKDIAI